MPPVARSSASATPSVTELRRSPVEMLRAPEVPGGILDMGWFSCQKKRRSQAAAGLEELLASIP